ncbi:hypothetical protein [Paenibacillus sp. QZ-Y1]|uniref:hypothetical protein n=1 Tax=Paenibacillus sp. QZ-Y1 TaxID=3414511 RepID=UPI003F79D5DB
MNENEHLKQSLIDARKMYQRNRKLFKSYMGRKVRIKNSELDLPEWIDTYEINEIDVSENVVALVWFDIEEQDWILEDITIAEFVHNAEFIQ